MRKLRLDTDALMVQSFETTAADRTTGGTVLGRADADKDKTYYFGCPTFDCPVTEQYSCHGTCGDGDTCWASCHMTCHTCMTACFASCEASCGGTCPACIAPTQPGYVCEATV